MGRGIYVSRVDVKSIRFSALQAFNLCHPTTLNSIDIRSHHLCGDCFENDLIVRGLLPSYRSRVLLPTRGRGRSASRQGKTRASLNTLESDQMQLAKGGILPVKESIDLR